MAGSLHCRPDLVLALHFPSVALCSDRGGLLNGVTCGCLVRLGQLEEEGDRGRGEAITASGSLKEVSGSSDVMVLAWT